MGNFIFVAVILIFGLGLFFGATIILFQDYQDTSHWDEIYEARKVFWNDYDFNAERSLPFHQRFEKLNDENILYHFNQTYHPIEVPEKFDEAWTRLKLH